MLGENRGQLPEVPLRTATISLILNAPVALTPYSLYQWHGRTERLKEQQNNGPERSDQMCISPAVKKTAQRVSHNDAPQSQGLAVQEFHEPNTLSPYLLLSGFFLGF